MSSMNHCKASLKTKLAARLRARMRLIELMLLDDSTDSDEAIMTQLQALTAESNFYQIQIFNLSQNGNDEMSIIAGNDLAKELRAGLVEENTAIINKLTLDKRNRGDAFQGCKVEPLRRVK